MREHGEFLAWFELVSLYIFAGEYALRLSMYRLRGDTRRFALAWLVASPMMLVDLIVIIPLLLPFLAVDTRVIQILRLLMLFTVFKMGRISGPMAELAGVIRSQAPDLTLAFFMLFIVLVLASTMIYYAERDAQPEVFSSIPASMWWGVVTLTTIGYGDTVPSAPPGQGHRGRGGPFGHSRICHSNRNNSHRVQRVPQTGKERKLLSPLRPKHIVAKHVNG